MKIISFALTVALVLAVSVSAAPAPAASAMGGSLSTFSAGGGNGFVIKTDGSLWACGDNEYGKLGDGSETIYNYDNLPSKLRDNDRYDFIKVMDGVVFVAAGSSHTMAIKTDGSLYGWGDNQFGALGIGTETICVPGEGRVLIDYNMHTPIKILDDVVSVTAGWKCTYAIKTDGSLWAWGLNNYGQLGDGTVENRLTPVKIMDDVIDVAYGSSYAFAIKSDNSLWSWGLNNNGQLGDGNVSIHGGGSRGYVVDNNRLTPAKIMDDVKSVSASWRHSMAIKTDGSLWAWGTGYLGDGIWHSATALPVKIMDGVAAVSATSEITLAIKYDGNLYSWGIDISCSGASYGYLGTRVRGDALYPTLIMRNIVAISTAHGLSLVMKADGSIWSWRPFITYGLEQPYTDPEMLIGGVMLPADAFMGISDPSVSLPSSGKTDSASEWAMGELDRALYIWLLPDSVINGGWQSPTSRLAAADALVRLIELSTGDTMAQIASANGWDLNDNLFSDTGSQTVTFLRYAGVTTGVGDNKYDPGGDYNRAQIVTMLGRIAEVFFGAAMQGGSPFSDVPGWAAPYVGYAASAGITDGVGGGRFDSLGVLQNQHTGVFCYRALILWQKLS